jgi:hypothetical protein
LVALKENQKNEGEKKERESVFPDGGRNRLLLSTTYYSSSSPMRLYALGKCFVKLKKERSRERRKRR